MTALIGTQVIAPLVPADDADIFPTHSALYGKGGLRTVASIAERDAIPADRRELGMVVRVTGGLDWTLIGGILNANWTVWTPAVGAALVFDPVDYGAVANGVTDDKAAIQAAIDAASALAESSFDQIGAGYFRVDLKGRKYRVASTLSISKKIYFGNGNLVVTSDFPAGEGDTSVVLLVKGFAATRCIIRDLEVDCGLDGNNADRANGIRFEDVQRVDVYNVNVFHGREFCQEVKTVQGGKFAHQVLRQYVTGETGLTDVSYWTAHALRVHAADCLFHNINAGNALRPLRLLKSANVFTACHFVNPAAAGTDDYVILDIFSDVVTPQYAVGNVFSGCYIDGGKIVISNSFYEIFNGCLFLRPTNPSNHPPFDLVATQAGVNVKGLYISGVYDGFSGAASFYEKTVSGGSFGSDPDHVYNFAIPSGGYLAAIPVQMGRHFFQQRTEAINPINATAVLGANRDGSFQAHDTAFSTGFVATKWGADANPATLVLGKSRGASPGAFGTFLSASDMVGRVQAVADRGSDFGTGGTNRNGALLEFYAPLAHASGDTPMGIRMAVTRDGTAGDAVNVLDVTSEGSLVVGEKVALATTATTGFLYVPSCAGTPTGTPAAETGKVPIVVDSTNNKLYFYSGGSWRDAGP